MVWEEVLIMLPQCVNIIPYGTCIAVLLQRDMVWEVLIMLPQYINIILYCVIAERRDD